MSQRQKVVLRSARAGLIALGLLCATGALAQANLSVLTGNVVDAASKAPVADVVVTATSPSLQGEQVVVTDGTGLYRIPQLPPGTYTLRFEKESVPSLQPDRHRRCVGPHSASERRASP